MSPVLPFWLATCVAHPVCHTNYSHVCLTHVRTQLVVLRASTIGACPSLRSSSLRCCRVIGGRRALIKIQSTAGEVTAEVVEVSSGQQTVLKMPTEDAGWLLREPCSSVRGLSRQQLARLAGLITTQGGATCVR